MSSPSISDSGILGSCAAPAGLERCSQRPGVVVPHQAVTFDEEGWGRVGSAGLGAREIAVDSFCDSLAVHVVYEAIDVQSEFFRVADELLTLERVLVGEDEIEPSPELALVRGCLDALAASGPCGWWGRCRTT